MADSYLVKVKTDSQATVNLKLVDQGDGTYALATSVTGRNASLQAETTVTWNGVKTSDTVEIPVTTATGILLNIDNSDTPSDLTATFEIEVTTGEWRQWYDGQGGAVSFTVTASTKRVYGPIQAFPRYLTGRIKLTAAAAPTNTKVTKVQAQEVV